MTEKQFDRAFRLALVLFVVCFVLFLSAHAQVPVSLSPVPRLQFSDVNGVPLAGGKVYTFAAGSTTPLSTYTDYQGVSVNPNPTILDAGGFASIWLGPYSYKFVVKNSANVQQYSVDHVTSTGPCGTVNGEIQYRDGHQFGCDVKFTWDAATSSVRLKNGAGYFGLKASGSGANMTITAPAALNSGCWKVTAGGISSFDRNCGSPFHNIVDYGAVNGADSTVAINAALAAGCPIYVPEGEYFFDAGVSGSATPVNLPSGCVVFGVGTITRKTPANGASLQNAPVFQIKNVSDVVIRGITIDGAKTSGATGITTGDLNFYSAADVYIENSTNVRLEDNTFQNSYGAGVDGFGWTDVSILNNVFSNWSVGNYGSVFLKQYLATSGTPARRIKVSGNYCDGSVSHSSCFKLFAGSFASYTKAYDLDVSHNDVVVGDYQRHATTGASITTGTAALTCLSCAFTSADVGLRILIEDAGAGTTELYDNIAAVVDSTHATLSANAGHTVANKGWMISGGTSGIEILSFNLLSETWASLEGVFGMTIIGNRVTGENAVGSAFPNALTFGISTTGQHIVISGNVVQDIHGYPIEGPGMKDAVVSNNVIVNGGNNTIDANCNTTGPVCYEQRVGDIVWSNNTVKSPVTLPGTNSALYLYSLNYANNGVDNVRVTGNYFEQPVALSFMTGAKGHPSAHIIEGNCAGGTCTNIAITNNTFMGAGDATANLWAAIAADSMVAPIITDNFFRNFLSVNSSPISLTANAGSVPLSGNVFVNNYAPTGTIPLVADSGIDAHNTYRWDSGAGDFAQIFSSFAFHTGNNFRAFAPPTTNSVVKTSHLLCAPKVSGSSYPDCYQGFGFTFTANDDDLGASDQGTLKIVGFNQDNIAAAIKTQDFVRAQTVDMTVANAMNAWRFGPRVNVNIAGHVTMTDAGTCTLGTSCVITFTVPYANAPICVATDSTAANATKVVSTISALTITGTGTDVIKWACFGN